MSSIPDNAPLPAFCFKVTLGTSDGATDAIFRSASGFGSETEVVEVREGGVNTHMIKLAGVTKWKNLVLKRGFSGDARAFLAWRQEWISGSDKTGAGSKLEVVVTALGADGAPLGTWTFTDAWPVKWELSDFDASKSEVLVETLELAHHGFIYKRETGSSAPAPARTGKPADPPASSVEPAAASTPPPAPAPAATPAAAPATGKDGKPVGGAASTASPAASKPAAVAAPQPTKPAVAAPTPAKPVDAKPDLAKRADLKTDFEVNQRDGVKANVGSNAEVAGLGSASKLGTNTEISSKGVRTDKEVSSSASTPDGSVSTQATSRNGQTTTSTSAQASSDNVSVDASASQTSNESKPT